MSIFDVLEWFGLCVSTPSTAISFLFISDFSQFIPNIIKVKVSRAASVVEGVAR
jgi:hypothetical protein